MVTFAEALLDAARADLDVRETSPNDGPRVAEMLAVVGLKPPQPWCAAAVTTWLRAAEAATGARAPIKGSALAQEIGRQLARADRWTPVGRIPDSKSLRPGMILVWERGPRELGRGHVGVIEQALGPRLVQTIEGNSGPLGDGVHRMQRSLDDPNLLGVGWVDVAVPVPPEPPVVEKASSSVPVLAAGVGVFVGALVTTYAKRRYRL